MVMLTMRQDFRAPAFGPASSAEIYSEALAMWEWADQRGWDMAVVSEHHGFDDGFALLGEKAAFSLAGAGRRLTVELLEGYAYAQIYAPAGDELIALEPMTAPTNALASGRGLRLAEPGSRFRTASRVRVESDDTTLQILTLARNTRFQISRPVTIAPAISAILI